MQVVVVASQKGGVGKSTIACNLAVCAALDNKKTLLIDSDSQKSSLSFRAIRGADDIKAVGITQATVHKDINNFDNFDFIFVDVGGSDNPAFRSAVMAARNGLMLIPILPSQLDVWATEDTFKILEEARSYSDIKAYVVFNRVIQNTKVFKDAQQTLCELTQDKNIGLMNTMLYSRTDYSSSISEGLGVIENTPKSKATKEIYSLYNEIKSKLEV